jgi:uncharacterized membrane protein YdjX (TVP38/TMEM64 family)
VLIYKNQALDLIFSYQEWIKNHFLITLLVFYSIFTFSGIIILPTAVFEITNGFIYATLFDGKIYGFFIGLIFHMIFNAISSTMTYMFSKFILGKRLKEILIDTSEKMQLLNLIFKTQGLKALSLLKLSPLLPVSIFNYAVGGFESKNIKKF